MITRNEVVPGGVHRVTVSLDPVDVDLLDRLARLEGEGQNRSSELRNILAQLRPMLQATVQVFEAAKSSRLQLDAAAAQATASELESILPEAEEAQRRFLGMIAKLEGAAAASDPRSSNTGVTPPTPTNQEDEN